jgi:hypothetical protein
MDHVRSLPTAFALVALLVSGCTLKSSVPTSMHVTVGTVGKEGKIGFSYAGLVKSCMNVDCAMMVGTTELIVMDSKQPLDAVFETSDPDVLAVLEGGRELEGDADGGVTGIDGFHVEARKAGVTELRVKTAAGEIVDRIDLHVEVPSRVALRASGAELTSGAVKVGDHLALGAMAYGANGAELEATTGWSFSGDNPAAATVSDACVLLCLTGDSTLSVTGVAPGSVHASATGGGVSGTATITVTR